MATITIDLDDELARYIEESARRARKSVSEWVKERVTPEADRAAKLAAIGAQAVANGYPPVGWRSTVRSRMTRASSLPLAARAAL